jgi:orotate phosphoribosyltransferase
MILLWLSANFATESTTQSNQKERNNTMSWTLDELLHISLSTYGSILPEPEEVLEWFDMLEAGWVYGGDPTKPHAILRSKNHSDGFFDCKKVLKHGNLREILAACMIKRLMEAGMGRVGCVLGSPQSSILLSGDVGRLLGVPTYVLEKDATDPAKKRMLFKPDDPIPENSEILHIEELVTTWDSGGATTEAVVAGNPNPVTFYPLVGVLVYRPPVIDRNLLDGRTIVPFIEKRVNAWSPESCPLCADGSKAIFPKTQWAELTA